MEEERFRLMYLSRGGIDIKQISLSWKRFYFYSFFGLIILVMLLVFGIGFFTRLYHNYQIIALENDREHLQRELLIIKERVSQLGIQLTSIESTGDELRNAANLHPIDDDTRQLGVGGSAFYGSFEFGYYPDEISRTANEIQLDLDKLERAVRLESSSMGEIRARLLAREDRINHFPSIRPILGGRITDRYGFRIDPFTKKNDFHEGIDIPMPRGTKVVATADGVVKEIRTPHFPHKDFGVEVVINHGYGFETRYAHLSKVLVRKGQKVKRWEPVGEVGDTGRATGYHLHYEVLVDRKRENPEYFIYN
jgi:hypothetical protein